MASIGLVAIQSVRFPNAFLRMNGSGVQFNDGGSGQVNCQYYSQGGVPVPNIGNDEVFELIPLGGHAGAYAIRSLNYPNAFLRMDFSNASRSANGSGIVNCQYYSSGDYPTDNSGDYEHFLIAVAVDATASDPAYYSIMSGPFGVFLRIDGSKVTASNANGSGTVNCQVYSSGTYPSSVEEYEVFNIIYLKPPSEVAI